MTITSVSNLYFTSEENRGIIMIKSVLLRIFVSLPLLLAAINAQDGVDAIEKARQAKEAADKAAAEAAAATEAAIEAAAAKAAKAAREDAKRKKEEEEARKVAEAKAAEEAELDAAAQAAAEAAKRKMAEELGLEVSSDESAESDETSVAGTEVNSEAEEVVAKEASGWNLGAAASVGLLSGETFTNVPTGGTIVLTTPFGFKLGPFDYTVSFGFGQYSGNYEGPDTTETFDPSFVGLGGNLTIADFIFAEGHIGTVSEGTGFRGFAGVTLERLMKNGLNLPLNILIGSEAFYSTNMSGGGNPSGWASLGIRLDFSF